MTPLVHRKIRSTFCVPAPSDVRAISAVARPTGATTAGREKDAMTSHPVGSTQGYRLAARHARLGAGLALTLLAGAAEAKTLSAMAPRTVDATKSAKSSIDDGLAGGELVVRIE